MVDPVQIEQRTDVVKAQSIEIGAVLGGIQIGSVADVAKIADLLSRGMIAVPVHCREQPGVCFALSLQALEWGMPIMSVINKSYVPRNGDRIGYESQLLHAVVEKNAPLKNRLRFQIGELVEEADANNNKRLVWRPGGSGDQRRCRVWGTFRGETEPHEYTSETLAKLHPGHSTKDNVRYVKGSQLWDSNPEVQLFYSASRQWARLYCPDVLLGAYAPEELEDSPPMMDVTPKVEALAQRLKNAKAASADRGFDADHVEREASARSSIIEGEVDGDDAKPKGAEEDGSINEPDVEGRQDGTADRRDGDRDAERSDDAGGADRKDGGKPAGDKAAQPQGEIFPPDRDKDTAPKPKGKR